MQQQLAAARSNAETSTPTTAGPGRRVASRRAPRDGPKALLVPSPFPRWRTDSDTTGRLASTGASVNIAVHRSAAAAARLPALLFFVSFDSHSCIFMRIFFAGIYDLRKL